MVTYWEWAKANDSEHAHCPEDCENPQPFVHGGVFICGACAALRGDISPMIPCTPETCE